MGDTIVGRTGGRWWEGNVGVRGQPWRLMVESSASQCLVSALSRQTPPAVSPHRRSFLTFLSSLPPATNGIALGLCGYISISLANLRRSWILRSVCTGCTTNHRSDGHGGRIELLLFGQARQCLGVCAIGVVVTGLSAQDAACAESKCACASWLASYEAVLVQCAELLGGRS